MEGVPGLLYFGDLKIDESEGNEDRDRLIELPNCLILFILSLLPLKDVVRTSVLSKQWKDLWTTIPVLDFGVQKYVDLEINCSNNCSNVFVNRVLEHWKGTKIMKFHVDLNCSCTTNRTDSWLDFAMDHGVEELSVYSSTHYYRAPLRLFSYSTIRKLYLFYCDIMITEKVLWNGLKNLEIAVLCLDDHVIDKIMSGAPQLEVLELVVVNKYDNLNIHSSSLKRLRIVLFVYLREEANTSLRIWAPNLQTLQISGAPCRRYLVMNLSSLKDLTFHLFDHHYDILRVLEAMLRQFLPTILGAEKVKLSNYCFQALIAFERKHSLSLSSHSKFVRVRSRSGYDVLNKIVDVDPGPIYCQLQRMVILHRSSYPARWAYPTRWVI